MLAVVQKKVQAFHANGGKNRKDEAEEHNILHFWASIQQFSIFKRSIITDSVLFFSLSLYWECLEWCEKHSTDNLPLHSRLMHCSIRGELMRKRDPIRAEPENNSIQRMLYLCYQVLHVVVCLSENSFKIKQCEEGRSLALFAIIVQSPL